MPGFLIIGETAYPAALAPGAPPAAEGPPVLFDGRDVWVHLDGETYQLQWRDAITHHAEAAGGETDAVCRAPMPGVVIAIGVARGDQVKAGDTLVVIESMKLETAVKASRNGVVESVHVAVGQAFERDAPLVTLTEEPS